MKTPEEFLMSHDSDFLNWDGDYFHETKVLKIMQQYAKEVAIDILENLLMDYEIEDDPSTGNLDDEIKWRLAGTDQLYTSEEIYDLNQKKK